MPAYQEEHNSSKASSAAAYHSHHSQCQAVTVTDQGVPLKLLGQITTDFLCFMRARSSDKKTAGTVEYTLYNIVGGI